MMENSKVNTMENMHVTDKMLDMMALRDFDNLLIPMKTSFSEWLNKESSIISQNDFDTCRSSYDDGNYDTCNGYRQAYNTYLDQFENC